MVRCTSLLIAVGSVLIATAAIAQQSPSVPDRPARDPALQSQEQKGKGGSDVNSATLATTDAIPEYASQGLGGYLQYMSSKLGCYYAIEDRPDADGFFPWISNIDNFERDFSLTTIDALVAHLNEEVEGVKFVRSTKVPSVVHVVAENLLVSGYAMDRSVTFSDYDGRLYELPNRIGSLVDDKVQASDGGAIPVGWFGDHKTEVEVDAANETVRDVLTKAVPLAGYNRFIWYATADDGNSKVLVDFGGPQEDGEASKSRPSPAAKN